MGRLARLVLIDPTGEGVGHLLFLDSGFRACVLALRCTKVSSILLCGRCLITSLLTITQKDYNEPQVRYLKSKQASEKTKADEWMASAAVLYCNIYSFNLILSYIHLPVTIISHKLTKFPLAVRQEDEAIAVHCS